MGSSRTVKVVLVGEDRASAAFGKAGRGVQQLEGTLARASGGMLAIGRRLAAATGVSTAAATAGIVKVGMAYEQSLNTFQAVSRANAAQMQKVRQQAKALGADMSLPATSAAGAAKAMTELAKAGLSVDQTLSAAKGTLQLAAAAQVDEATAAGLTANALNAFGLSGSKAVQVADLLAAAANASSGEVTDFGLGMQQAASTFAAAGIPIQDLTASLAQMANNGIKGQDAGTSLKTMLQKLQGPSAAAAGAMKQIGFSVYDASGAMKPYRQIIAELTAKTKNMTDAERGRFNATVFGTDATRAALTVLEAGTTAYGKNLTAVTRQGAAADVAAAKTKGLKGAFDGLRSQLETLAVSLYEKISPALERITRKFAGKLGAVDLDEALRKLRGPLNTVGQFLAAAGKAAVAMAPAAAALATIVGGALLTAMKALTPALKFIGQHSTAFSTLAAAVGGAALAYAGIIKPILAVRTAMIALNLALAANPIGLVVVALAALAAAFVVLWQRSETFRIVVLESMKVAAKAVRFFVDAGLTYFGFFIKGAAKLFGWVPGVGPKLKEAAKGFDDFKNSVDRKFSELDASLNAKIGVTAGNIALKARLAGLKTGQQLMAGANKGIRDKALSVSEAAASVIANAGKTREAYLRGVNLGADFMAGINKGIRSGALSLSEAAASVVTRADQAARVASATRSPSLKWAQHGRFLVDGLILGINQRTGAAQAAAASAMAGLTASAGSALLDTLKTRMQDLADKAQSLRDAFGGSVTGGAGLAEVFGKVTAEQQKAAEDAAKEQTAATARLAEAQTAAAAAQTEYNDAASSDNTDGLSAASERLAAAQRDVVDATAAVAKASDDVAAVQARTKLTVQTILDELKTRVLGAQAFARDLGQLTGLGLSDGLIKEIAGAGVETGDAIAKALIDAGPGAIGAVNDLTSQLQQVATTGMDQIAASLYGPAAQLVANMAEGIRSQLPELSAAVDEILALARKVDSSIRGIAPAPITATPVGTAPGAGGSTPAGPTNTGSLDPAYIARLPEGLWTSAQRDVADMRGIAGQRGNQVFNINGYNASPAELAAELAWQMK